MLRYFLFHKPYQVLSQFSPEENKRTLADYLVSLPRDVYPAGRLDYDSEGLLLLTNDKQLIHRLLEPRFSHPRTYWVQVEGDITEDALSRLRQGVPIRINGRTFMTRPAGAVAITAPDVPERTPPVRFRMHIPTSWMELTLTEGKNRQVRRMTAAVGYPTLRLIRSRIGSLVLGDLKPGAYRELKREELSALQYS